MSLIFQSLCWFWKTDCFRKSLFSKYRNGNLIQKRWLLAVQGDEMQLNGLVYDERQLGSSKLTWSDYLIHYFRSSLRLRQRRPESGGKTTVNHWLSRQSSTINNGLSICRVCSDDEMSATGRAHFRGSCTAATFPSLKSYLRKSTEKLFQTGSCVPSFSEFSRLPVLVVEKWSRQCFQAQEAKQKNQIWRRKNLGTLRLNWVITKWYSKTCSWWKMLMLTICLRFVRLQISIRRQYWGVEWGRERKVTSSKRSVSSRTTLA